MNAGGETNLINSDSMNMLHYDFFSRGACPIISSFYVSNKLFFSIILTNYIVIP